jgi:CRP-like cAMP-binding protein
MTISDHQLPGINRMLARLPPRDRVAIQRLAEAIELTPGTILSEPDQAFGHVYFPTSGFISLAVTLGEHPPLQIGLTGNEGMLGATMALDIGTLPLRSVVQGPGAALRISTARFRLALRSHPALMRSLRHYLYSLMRQIAQTTACTRFHQVDKRLARWLLMTHDRVETDHFHLTHQMLADMLGVRRSGITIAAGALQQRRLIGYTRGEIRILDRKGLEAMSCECYRAIDSNDYGRRG